MAFVDRQWTVSACSSFVGDEQATVPRTAAYILFRRGARRIRSRGDVPRCIVGLHVVPVGCSRGQAGVRVGRRRACSDLTERTTGARRTPNLVAGHTDIVGRCCPGEVDLALTAAAVANWRGSDKIRRR